MSEATQWKKSSRCANGTCVLVRRRTPTSLVVQMRDSKDGNDGPLVEMWLLDWNLLVEGMKAGAVCPRAGSFMVRRVGNRWFAYDSLEPGVELGFTDEEWREFVEAVRRGEFDMISA